MNAMIPTDAITAAIRAASTDGRVPFEGADAISGHSGGRLTGLLQRLMGLFEREEAAYLEVGVFQGLTLLSVAAANRSLPCYGIDNFAFFDPDHRNRDIVLARKEKLGTDNAHLIDSDYEDAFDNLREHIGDRKIGVYFIDGPHDYRSQLMCLLLAVPFLHPSAIVVVDDSNYAHVRQANRDFLRTIPDFKLAFEAYTSAHPGELKGADLEAARAGWWDGVNVLVRGDREELPYREPPTVRDRTRFENDHIVHAGRLAELAPGATRLLDALLGFRLPEAAVLLWRGWRERRQSRDQFRGRSVTRNTHSAEIAGEHWDPIG